MSEINLHCPRLYRRWQTCAVAPRCMRSSPRKASVSLRAMPTAALAASAAAREAASCCLASELAPSAASRRRCSDCTFRSCSSALQGDTRDDSWSSLDIMLHRCACLCAGHPRVQVLVSLRWLWTGWCSCLRSSTAPMRCCDASMAVSSRVRCAAELCSSPCSRYQVQVSNRYIASATDEGNARWQGSCAGCLPVLRRGCP